ncbi:MAG: sugar ABC transporter substrate-binding protein [Actinomycetota bacterium]|nr:MAG: sugar ABC transporter substrate-binding protein [Actinomycetota bacterium]
MKFWYRKEGDSTLARSSVEGDAGTLNLGISGAGQKIRWKPRSVGMAAMASMALVAAACGSSNSSASSTNSTSSPSGPNTSGSSSAASLASTLKALEAMPTFKAPGPAIDASKLAGKSIVIVNGDPAAAPPSQTVKGVEAAAQVAGIKTTLLNGTGSQVAVYTQLLDQAISRKPMAIVTVAVVPSLVKTQLQAAKDAGIPVIIGLQRYHSSPTGPNQLAGSLYYGLATQPAPIEGTILAEQVAVDGPPDATIGFISSNVIPLSPQIFDAFKAGLTKYCPGCKIITTQNVDPSNWVASLSSTVSSMLSAHPNMNYLVPVFDGMAPFVISALGTSGGGHNVKVITTQGSVGAAMSAVQKGTFLSDVGTSSAWDGWVALDQALRAGLGLPPETDPNIPVRLVTAAQLKGVDPNSDAAVYGTSFQDGFKKLWGLS